MADTGFDRQPTLRGPLLELRPLRADDFDALYAVARDPLLWAQHPARDRWQEPVFRALFEESLASGGALVAIDRATGRVIGSSRFHGHDPARREIEIGWSFLARAFWGGVYNGEMKQLMLQHAFRFVDRVVFLIGPDNGRSRRAVEKLGAVQVADRPDPARPARVCYVLDAAGLAQWASRRAGLTPSAGDPGGTG